MSTSPIADTASTVLVVDDNPLLLGYITDTLEELGAFRVETAADGATGLERYFEVHPDCMVIDIKMPGLDGYQLVRALRGDPASETTALIILTAMPQDVDRLAGLLSGADQYLVKPVKPLELVAAIQQAVSLNQEERARRWQRLLDAEV
jgi:two-component system alkaline phosphatase synthesis response regulator PhoP